MISSLVYRPIPFHGLKNSWLIVYGPYYMIIIDLIKQILSKCAFNLPNINSRVQRTADVHQDFSFKQFVLASQNVQFYFNYCNTICYISKLMANMRIAFIINKSRSEIKLFLILAQKLTFYLKNPVAVSWTR